MSLCKALTSFDKPLNWLTLTASVGLTPGATLVMRRSDPDAPTETVLAWLATEPAPSATEFGAEALALFPKATLASPDAMLKVP
jgi:hypothetical protein